MELVCESLEKHGYKYINTIGKGGYALCMKVENKRYQDTEFACKMIFINDESKAEKSYYAEIDALISINDPNIVRIYDHFVEEKQYFIILELCSNGSLDTVSKTKTALNDNTLTTYARSILRALSSLHEHHLAHHDIKPANFFVDNYGRAKIGDFGIAKKYEPDQLSTSFEGSLPYLPPEVIRMKPYDPFKADIWALGVSLYELGTRSQPFKGSSKQEIKKSILSGVYPAPKGLSTTIKNVIQSCLKEDPAQRPTAKQLYSMVQPLVVQPTQLGRPNRIIKPINSYKTIGGFKSRTIGSLPKLQLSNCVNKQNEPLSS